MPQVGWDWNEYFNLVLWILPRAIGIYLGVWLIMYIGDKIIIPLLFGHIKRIISKLGKGSNHD